MKKRLLAMVFVILTVSLVVLSGCGNYGTFYSLTEAYEEGLITYEDLLSIAYYKNGGTRRNEDLMGEDYEPIPQEPLDKKIEKKIKKTEAYYLRKYSNINEATADGITVKRFFGKYQNCYIIQVENSFTYSLAYVIDYWGIIGGVHFHETYTPLKVWVEN